MLWKQSLSNWKLIHIFSLQHQTADCTDRRYVVKHLCHFMPVWNHTKWFCNLLRLLNHRLWLWDTNCVRVQHLAQMSVIMQHSADISDLLTSQSNAGTNNIVKPNARCSSHYFTVIITRLSASKRLSMWHWFTRKKEKQTLCQTQCRLQGICGSSTFFAAALAVLLPVSRLFLFNSLTPTVAIWIQL